MQRTIELPNEENTIQVAQQLAPCLITPVILTFSGEIGAGKTTFIRALLRALGVTSAIKSPTFSLVESYQCNSIFIHHFDLYRINDETELEFIGFRDYFVSQSICCIEWPERAPAYLRDVDLCFTLTMKGNGRLIHINAESDAGETMLACLAGQ